MAQELNQPRKLLFAFMNGSYKTIDAVKYDHKEWIIVEKKDGTKAFINSANVKWIEEIKPAVEEIKKAPTPPNYLNPNIIGSYPNDATAKINPGLIHNKLQYPEGDVKQY